MYLSFYILPIFCYLALQPTLHSSFSSLQTNSRIQPVTQIAESILSFTLLQGQIYDFFVGAQSVQKALVTPMALFLLI